jgi:hypothetical protein
MLKRLAILALLCVPFVSAKSYTFTVSTPVQAGTAQLKPGQYSLTLKGSDAVFTDENGRRTEAPAKIEPADSKFDETTVNVSTTNGVERVESIGLGGTKNKVVFNQ